MSTKTWLLPATRSPGDPGQTPGASVQDTLPGRTAELAEGWAHRARQETGQAKDQHNSIKATPQFLEKLAQNTEQIRQG